METKCPRPRILYSSVNLILNWRIHITRVTGQGLCAEFFFMVLLGGVEDSTTCLASLVLCEKDEYLNLIRSFFFDPVVIVIRDYIRGNLESVTQQISPIEIRSHQYHIG